ncbi:MAG: hypothetical protein IKY26_05540, partial [Erysipelotrichaceae bacterium]|nr:hypothetical protein [Erysipelotrichaceae bacterium]
MIYTSDSSFWQPEPQPITIGCDNCDVYIYRMKAYSTSLTDKDILNNFSIVKNIGDKFDNISLKNILKIENKSTTDEYNYEDVSKEIEAL